MAEILYRNKDFIIINKPVPADSEREVPALLEKEGIHGAKCFHRLDREVGGVMLLTLSPDAPKKLEGVSFTKEYTAEIIGCPAEKSGEMTDLLYHDRRANKTFTVKKKRAGVKEAKLFYDVISEGEKSLVRVRLVTGRTHQIRVQFASRGMPVSGDGRYGGGKGVLKLFSSSLSFEWEGETVHIEKTPYWIEI